jgi:hypothetical protein
MVPIRDERPSRGYETISGIIFGCLKKEKKIGAGWKWWFIFIAFFMSFFNLAPNAFAQDDADTRPTLRGFSGVYVVVEPLSPQIENEGLTTDQLQKDIVEKIRTAGVKVLSKEEFFKTPGKPYLYVNASISILRTQITRYIFYIRPEPSKIAGFLMFTH